MLEFLGTLYGQNIWYEYLSVFELLKCGATDQAEK